MRASRGMGCINSKKVKKLKAKDKKKQKSKRRRKLSKRHTRKRKISLKNSTKKEEIIKKDIETADKMSDDKIKQEIKAFMEETGFVWESVMDYMSDDFVINNADEKKIYSEIIGEYHSWKKEEDTDLYAYTEELINLKIKE